MIEAVYVKLIFMCITVILVVVMDITSREQYIDRELFKNI